MQDPPATVSADPGAPVFEWVLRAELDAGIKPGGVEAMRAIVQAQVAAGDLPGAVVALARHGTLFFYEAFGLKDLETGEAMRVDDVFRMASSTKPLTATCILMLMEEGALDLDDPVSRFLPEFAELRVAVVSDGTADDQARTSTEAARRQITIRDLLTHTSGLSSIDLTLQPGPGSRMNPIRRAPEDTLATYVPRLAGAILDFQPGSAWRYSPLDPFDVALRIVELASGHEASAFMKARILEPLDMRDTVFNLRDDQRDRLVGLYGRQDGAWRPAPHILGTDDATPYVSGAGGLYGTARDFLHFELMLLGKGVFNGRRILRPETVEQMSCNHVGSLFAECFPPLTGGMGFGLSVGVVDDPDNAKSRANGAFGWGGAYGTESWADPALDVAGVVLIQVTTGSAVVPELQAALRKSLTD